MCGRKLIWVTASTLPSMGITDWKHIQVKLIVICVYTTNQMISTKVYNIIGRNTILTESSMHAVALWLSLILFLDDGFSCRKACNIIVQEWFTE